MLKLHVGGSHAIAAPCGVALTVEKAQLHLENARAIMKVLAAEEAELVVEITKIQTPILVKAPHPRTQKKTSNLTY